MTGTYVDIGEFRGKRAYQRVPDNWFLWWDGVSSWCISDQAGFTLDAWWQRISPDIQGKYQPQIPATGEATVTEIEV